MNIGNDEMVWLSSFFSKIRVRRLTLNELLANIGVIESSSTHGDVKNHFIRPFDKMFKSICIVESVKEMKIKAISFILFKNSIPYNWVRGLSYELVKQFIIYDEKVEFIFSIESEAEGVKQIVTTYNEDVINTSETEDAKLCFNNIMFKY